MRTVVLLSVLMAACSYDYSKLQETSGGSSGTAGASGAGGLGTGGGGVAGVGGRGAGGAGVGGGGISGAGLAGTRGSITARDCPGSVPRIDEFAIGSTNVHPTGLAAGGDGNLWVLGDNEVVKISPNGSFVNGINLRSQPNGIAADSDHVWIVEGYYFARITTDGTDATTEKPLPGGSDALGGIAIDDNGDVWYTDLGTSVVARISSADLTVNLSVQIPFGDSPPFVTGITNGSDGQLWFIVNYYLGVVSTSGVINGFQLGSGLTSITSGPDGNLWMTDGLFDGSNDIKVVSPANQPSIEVMFPVADGAGTTGISKGPDGNLWFVENNANVIACITSRGSRMGAISEFHVPTTGALPATTSTSNIGVPLQATASGLDGNLWFTEKNVGKIARITLSP